MRILILSMLLTSCTIQRNKQEVKPWPKKVITYCFLEVVKGDKTPMPQEYRGYAIECANEWSEVTELTLIQGNYSDKPAQPGKEREAWNYL